MPEQSVDSVRTGRRKTANIDIRVEPDLIRRIDAWRRRQLVMPTRSAAVIHMIEAYLHAPHAHNRIAALEEEIAQLKRPQPP